MIKVGYKRGPKIGSEADIYEIVKELKPANYLPF